jgi:hypothetical protein
MTEKNALANLSSSANSTEVTLQKILASKTSPALSELKKNKGEQTALGVLVALMDECQQYFNLQQPMNAQQLMLTAELIMEEYYYLRIEELRMCFRMAMKGEFGPVYNRIDGQVFFEWIVKYMPKRQLITDRMKQEQQSNNNIYELFAHPQMTEALNDVVQKIEERKSEVPAQEPTREQPSQLEIALMREYDALPQWDNDMRFRVYNNKPYQFTEFRMERYRELIEQQNEY